MKFGRSLATTKLIAVGSLFAVAISAQAGAMNQAHDVSAVEISNV
jgi:hypothetical protein